MNFEKKLLISEKLLLFGKQYALCAQPASTNKTERCPTIYNLKNTCFVKQTMALMFGESEEAHLKQMLRDAYNDVPFIEHDEEEVRLKQMLQDAYNDVPFHDEEGLLLRNLKQFYQRVKVLLKTY